MKLFLFLALIFFGTLYADDKARFVAQHDDWEVYSQIEDGKKVCFIVSSPIDKSGNYSKRGNSYLWVRHVSKDIDELSVTPGYKYKIATNAEVSFYDKDSNKKRTLLLERSKEGKCRDEIDEGKYSLDLVEQEQAWAYETDTDIELVTNMKKSYYAIVTAISMKDTCSTDIYSLVGFTKAYRHMKSLCSE